MIRRVWAWAAITVLMILCACPLAAAAEETILVGWRVEIPMAGLPDRLDKTDSGKTVDLLTLADGTYTLSLTPLRMGKESWVRALLTKNGGFLGLCMLGTRAEAAALKGIRVEIDLRPESTLLRFSAQPEGRPLAAVELPLAMEGECRLLPVAQSQGVTVTPVEVPRPTEPAAQQVDASAAQQVDASAAQPEDAGLPSLRLHPGIYALALLITALVLAALVLGNMHWRHIAALALRAKELALSLWLYIYARVTALRKPREKAARASAPAEDTLEIPRVVAGPHLPGLRVMESEHSALVRQITMRTAWESAEEPSPEGMPARLNEYFLGRAPVPAEGRYLTVGLRNRDALQQLGGGSVRPLFAPNPRGQIFSLEEESGGLYLHVDYFAPPSFMMQPVLRSVCLECVFSLEDVHGAPLRLENVQGHTILGIAPALTARTEAGFIVTQKGKLVIGEN